MSNFKKVLEVEKKFQHQINLLDREFDLKKNNFLEDLKLKEEVVIKDIKDEFERDLEKNISNFHREGSLIYDDASNKVNYLENENKLNKVRELILSKIINFGVEK